MLSVDLEGPASYTVIGGSGSRRHRVLTPREGTVALSFALEPVT
jgi:hypothetical protein